MNELVIKDEIIIENLIYEIRGKQVMLDSDLARLYQCTNGTKTINQAVNRHIDRFPIDFYFRLTEEEYNFLRSQIGTLKKGRGQHKKYLPFVFTEQGVAMLATVLRTSVASQMSISIMRAFVTMRKFISTNLIEQKYINNLVLEDHNKIKMLESSFNKLEEKSKVNEIFFEGQIYDAYSKIQELFKSATKRLVIVDAYADYTVLDIIKRLNVDVIIITKKDNLLTKQDIEKYNKQYHNLKVIFNNSFHDRYFIIDEKKVYHYGAYSLSNHSWDDPVNRFVMRAKEINIEYMTPLIGETVNLNDYKNYQNEWWKNIK